MNHARLACLVALLLFASLTAQAQSNAPPPSAAKEGGGTPEGDPSGAVRALGSADETKTKGTVTVPDVGGVHDGERRGPPPDTAR